MTHSKLLFGLAVGLALFVVSADVFANGSQMLDIPFDASLSGQQVQAGRYKISWAENSPEATVTLAKGKTIVATVRGTLVDRGSKANRTAVVYKTKADGTELISEIRFKGSEKVLVFSE